jgi:glycosyltransferase involved in cell wall biosynthesis
MTERGAPELISVVMPVLNAEDHVHKQLAALTRQTYRGAWELVVVDNGCRDRSVEIVRSWAGRIPALRVVDARGQRGLNYARNAGSRAARGDFLAFCDADDVATPGWLEALAAAATTADIVGGPLDFEAINGSLARAWRPPKPRQTELPMDRVGFLPYVPGGNCGIWAGVARSLGWDEAFVFGASDQEFSWRAQLASYRLAFVPEAVMQLRYRTTPGATGRQYFAYGSSGAQLYRRFRHAGMRRSDPREALRWWWWLAVHLPDLFRSSRRRGTWMRVAGLRLGRLVGSVRHRTVFL